MMMPCWFTQNILLCNASITSNYEIFIWLEARVLLKLTPQCGTAPCEVPQPFRHRRKCSKLNTFSVLLFIIQAKGVRKSRTELSMLSFETGVNFWSSGIYKNQALVSKCQKEGFSAWCLKLLLFWAAMSVKQFILRTFSHVPSLTPCWLERWPERAEIGTNSRKEKLYHEKSLL